MFIKLNTRELFPRARSVYHSDGLLSVSVATGSFLANPLVQMYCCWYTEETDSNGYRTYRPFVGRAMSYSENVRPTPELQVWLHIAELHPFSTNPKRPGSFRTGIFIPAFEIVVLSRCTCALVPLQNLDRDISTGEPAVGWIKIKRDASEFEDARLEGMDSDTRLAAIGKMVQRGGSDERMARAIRGK